ncbi:hypothetical protein D0T53_00045 [Dysgonomonas sp. 216]|uniref:glycosyltransferase family 9 protein n=1 Tax=Dysgonomonas sp. 216 TaxID=2302934 RepID=UPI0013D34E72|nr:glycosyltransferase family 9 protein [Dysgonomonas sp. 216]NDW17303.1 hypothetical protein [Dysgonomonas sp. 216]
MANTLILRYSRIGDAIIPIPLIYALAIKYPEDNFTILSHSLLEPLFKAMPENVTFVPMISKGEGFLRGPRFILKRLLFYRKLRQLAFDKIAVLQYDTFSKKLLKNVGSGTQVAISDELEFRDINRLKKANFGNLSMTRIYKGIFNELGYDNLDPEFDSLRFKNESISDIYSMLDIAEDDKVIAIAPFSKEKQKIYPLDRMKEVAGYFAGKKKCKVLILGGGQKEENVVEEWRQEYPQIISVINKFSFADELRLIAHANIVLSMDSANLHIASLLKAPTVSIWGATHPLAGYYTPQKNTIYKTVIKNCDCQPCSIVGSAPCTQAQQMKCMDIAPSLVINAITELLEYQYRLEAVEKEVVHN